MSTSRFIRQARQSLWAETIAAGLYGAVMGRPDECREELGIMWHVANPIAKPHFRQAALRAIRMEDAGARAMASFRARETFERILRQRLPVIAHSFQAAQIHAAFDACLETFFDVLEHGTAPPSTPDEEGAYTAGVARNDEDLTGQARS